MGPFTAALWSLVPSAGVGAIAPLTGALVQRFDRATLAAAGFLLATGGFGMLTQLHASSHLRFPLVGCSLYASGLVMVMTVGTELIMGAVPPERAGSASAVVETGTEFGGALGMAMLGSIGTAVYRGHLTSTMPAGLPVRSADTARETLGGAVATASRMQSTTGAALLHAARDSFTHGVNAAALGAGIVTLTAALLSVALFRGVRVEQAPVPVAQPTVVPSDVEVGV
jgi:MFS transporter, DHA2 family, multidrug resistance protein